MKTSKTIIKKLFNSIVKHEKLDVYDLQFKRKSTAVYVSIFGIHIKTIYKP